MIRNKIDREFEKIRTSTIIRVVALILSLTNECIAVIGRSSFADATEYQLVSLILLIVIALWNAWMNNDFTKAARISSAVFDAISDGKITEEEIKNMLTLACTSTENTNSESSQNIQNKMKGFKDTTNDK